MMTRFGKKKSYIEYLYTKPSLVILFGLVCFLSFSVFERYTIEREMSERRADVQRQQEELLMRKEQLSEKVEYLEGERGIEEEIRKHFDVAKEGEQVVILVGEDEKIEAEIDVPAEKSPWYVFWR